MARSDEGTHHAPIAPRGNSLDVEERQKRYTITMIVRTACFLLFLVVPGWWKIVALAGAAVIPAFAVVLANGEDHRATHYASDDDTVDPLALPAAEVIPGEVEPE